MGHAAPSLNPIEKIKAGQCLIASYLGPSGLRRTPSVFSKMTEIERSHGTFSLFLIDGKRFSVSNTVEDAILAMVYLQRSWQAEIEGFGPVNVWSVGSSAANPGYGPVLYRLAMQSVCYGDYDWMTCGDDVSASANRLWRRLYQDPDIEAVPRESLAGNYIYAPGKYKPLHKEPYLNAIYRYAGNGIAGSDAAFRRGEALVQKYGSSALHWLDQFGVRYFFARAANQWQEEGR